MSSWWQGRIGRAGGAASIALSLVSTIGCENRRRLEPGVEAVSAVSSAPETERARTVGPTSSLYGAPLKMQEPSDLSEILRDPTPFVGRTLLVEGAVRRACSRKGCWMELASAAIPDAPSVRVTFQDYAFFVPTDAAGSRARVEGRIEVKEVKKSHVDHLEAEGATFANKEADGSAREVRFVATGVLLSRG